MFLGLCVCAWGGGLKTFHIRVCWLTNFTVITSNHVICKSCQYSPFILKYLQEKVIRKQDLAHSPSCHANRLCSPVYSSRKCGNIIFPARQQSNWLCFALFFFIMFCINFPFTWFAISFFSLIAKVKASCELSQLLGSTETKCEAIWKAIGLCSNIRLNFISWHKKVYLLSHLTGNWSSIFIQNSCMLLWKSKSLIMAINLIVSPSKN